MAGHTPAAELFFRSAGDFVETSTTVTSRIDLYDQPDEAFSFGDLPDELRGQAMYKELDKRLKDYLFRHHSLSLYKSPALGRMAPAGSSEGEARVFFTQGIRELRDLESEKVRATFATRAKALEKKIREAGERLSREQAELSQASWTTAINMGTTVLGAFFGKKLGSRQMLARLPQPCAVPRKRLRSGQMSSERKKRCDNCSLISMT